MLSYSVSKTKWRNNNEGGELGTRGSAFFFAMEIVSSGIAGEFAQQGRVLHRTVERKMHHQTRRKSPPLFSKLHNSPGFSCSDRGREEEMCQQSIEQGKVLSPSLPRRAQPVPCSGRPESCSEPGTASTSKIRPAGRSSNVICLPSANSNMSRFGCLNILKTASTSEPKSSDAC
jgi:hypothetical protein